MAAKKTSKKTASPKTAKKSGKGSRGPRSGSKTAFILSHPLDSAAKAVVEAGKAAGHIFNDTYVWAVRASAKRKGAAAAPKGVVNRAEAALAKLASKGVAAVTKRGPGRPRKAAQGDGGAEGALLAGGSLEAQFAGLAVELGISRAEAILRRVREVLGKLTF